jgi:DNA-binding transcriptional ArsR family regulator
MRRGLRVAGTDQLSAVFSALADPTRRAILAGLAESDATVTKLTAPLSISMPAADHRGVAAWPS